MRRTARWVGSPRPLSTLVADVQMYAITVTAMGEVRDADGNLVSSSPVEAVMEVTEDQLNEMFGA